MAAPPPAEGKPSGSMLITTLYYCTAKGVLARDESIAASLGGAPQAASYVQQGVA